MAQGWVWLFGRGRSRGQQLCGRGNEGPPGAGGQGRTEVESAEGELLRGLASGLCARGGDWCIPRAPLDSGG